jgi:D-galactose 1-dehydrogenase
MRVIESDRIAIVEKPLCTSQSEMDALLTAARTRKLPLYTAFHPAYGREVDWWREQRDARNFDLGALLGFDTCFADPYYIDGKLTLGAVGKAGAWTDSGASGLSALARLIDPRTMQVVDGRMTVIPSLVCAQVQGLGIYSFVEQGITGYGMVDTNWTLGKNYKTTRLRYENGTVELDHAKELATLHQVGHDKIVFNLATNKPRLVNHYCGVFSDLTAMFAKGEDNTGLSEILHRLLFSTLNH